jgi:hypothetical protein
MRRSCSGIGAPFLDFVANRAGLNNYYLLDRARLGNRHRDQRWRAWSHHLWLYLCHIAAMLSGRFLSRVCIELSNGGRKYVYPLPDGVSATADQTPSVPLDSCYRP